MRHIQHSHNEYIPQLHRLDLKASRIDPRPPCAGRTPQVRMGRSVGPFTLSGSKSWFNPRLRKTQELQGGAKSNSPPGFTFLTLSVTPFLSQNTHHMMSPKTQLQPNYATDRSEDCKESACAKQVVVLGVGYLSGAFHDIWYDPRYLNGMIQSIYKHHFKFF